MTYYLMCNRCGFTHLAEDLDETLAVHADHRRTFGDSHFVEFEAIDVEPLFRGDSNGNGVQN